jgi:MFS family permease
MAVYGCGSLLTAVSWSVPSLTFGWSLLEGIGAAMVLPALVALTATSYTGRARATAYGVLGGTRNLPSRPLDASPERPEATLG